jgi:fido (protein-threonine AMPylation protein)
MEKRFQRPRTDQELKQREAAGLWRAQALAKEIGESKERITLDVILRIHRVFFEHAFPDIAGRFRGNGENIKKLKCIEPPPGVAVHAKMYEFWRELDNRLSIMPSLPGRLGKKSLRKALEVRNDAIADLATWTQYQIAAIHPFCEGNGRMARIMTNLILYRFRLQPTDIKYEGENKAAYLNALCSIDHEGDFRQLKQLVVKGIVASYQKLVDAQEKSARKHTK